MFITNRNNLWFTSAGIVVFTLLLACTDKAVAQDIHFSHQEYSPQLLNPALTGADYELKMALVTRSQWNALSSPYKTMNASFDKRLGIIKNEKKGFLAAGGNLFYDRTGDGKLSTATISLSFASHVFLDSKNLLGSALYAGIGQRHFNNGDLTWSNQFTGAGFDPSVSPGENFNSESFLFADLGAGVVYSFVPGGKYFMNSDAMHVNAGLAAFHVNSPDYSFLSASDEKLYMRYSAFANGLFQFKKSALGIMPGIYYTSQGPSQEILFGSYLRFSLLGIAPESSLMNKMSYVSVGIFHRLHEALVTKILYEWLDYSLGAGYDLNLKSLSNFSGRKDGFEILFQYTPKKNKGRYNLRKS